MISIGDRYVCERELGRGGMATVMLARDLAHDRYVAVKILRPELASAVSHQRFLREIRLIAQLQHPNIVPLYDSGVSDGLPFYVMPYVEGESLRTRLGREKQLPIADSLEMIRAVGSALAYAHRQGLVHRDIKPENILISQGHPLLADFGVARALTEAADDRLTSTGLAIGTPAYMSPEQATGERDVDARSDIYSLGCVLFEMLAGVPPFTGPTPQSVLAQRAAVAAPPVSRMRPTVPPHVVRALGIALERAPADRFQSVDAFCHRLASTAPPPWRALADLALHRPLRFAAGLALLLAAVAALRSTPIGNGVRRLLQGGDATAIAEARAAMGQGQLLLGRRLLAPVLASDPTNVAANLWWAQLGSMEVDSVDAWQRAARLALEHGSELRGADQARAAALAAWAEDRDADACPAFQQTVDSAPGDFSALLSLAHCMAGDDGVVRDPASPSGWRFRYSAQAAVRLYERVLEDFPNTAPGRALAVRWMARLLSITPWHVRAGRSAEGDTLRFGAYPTVQGDTLTFIPYPLSDLAVGRPGVSVAGMLAGLEFDRGTMRGASLAWAHDFPRDADAHAELAEVLEETGEILPMAQGSPSALDEIRTARALTAGSLDTARVLTLVSSDVRLRLKLGRFAEAAAVIDTALRACPPARPACGDALTPLAVIAGRGALAAQYNRHDAPDYAVHLTSGRPYRPPVLLGALALEVEAFAAAGGPVDSIRTLTHAIDSLLPSYTSPPDRIAVRTALVMRPLLISAPLLGGDAVGGLDSTADYDLRILSRLERHDVAGVRAGLRAVSKGRAALFPGATSFDATYIEAWARAQIGDTAGATETLNETLNGLSATGTELLDDPVSAGALVKAMQLRATLDARHGGASAEHWAAALCSLWTNGDAYTQSVRRGFCDQARTAQEVPNRS